jgi:hypothetical protein
MILISIFGRSHFYNSSPHFRLSMTRDLKLDKRSSGELFMQHLTFMMVQVKEIKTKAMKNDLDGIIGHVAKMKSSLFALMGAEFERTVNCTDFYN